MKFLNKKRVASARGALVMETFTFRGTALRFWTVRGAALEMPCPEML